MAVLWLVTAVTCLGTSTSVRRFSRTNEGQVEVIGLMNCAKGTTAR